MLVRRGVSSVLSLALLSALGACVAPTEPGPGESSPAVPEHDAADLASAPQSSDVAERAAVDGSRPAAGTSKIDVPKRELRVQFRGPMGAEIRLASAHLELRPLGGGESITTEFDSPDARFEQASEGFEPAPVGAYELTVESPGSRPYRARVEVRSARDASASDQLVDAYLWPDDAIAVRVRTSDDGDVAELAARIGIEDPDALFLGAFRVAVVPGATGPFDWHAEPAAAARVESPVHSWEWRTPPDAIAAIFPRTLPLRVGLEFQGRPVDVVTLRPGASEVVFRLDESAFGVSFGALRFRPTSHGKPARGARVTLLPRNAYHRRREFVDVAAGSGGAFAFDHLTAEPYELRVERGTSTWRDDLVIARGETLDLGDVDLDALPELAFRVVDERGRPVLAMLDVAPYDAARDATAQLESVVPSFTDERGLGALSMPRKKLLARASAANAHGANELDPHSGFVVIDPLAPPSAPLVFVLHPSVAATFRVERADAGALELVDEHGIAVAREPIDPTGETDVQLVRGTYRARLLGAGSALLAERAFEIADEPVTIDLR